MLYEQTFLRDISLLLYEYVLIEIPLYCMDIFFEREKMEYLLTGKEMTECDRYTWEAIGIPALVLMERAALGLVEEIRRDCPVSMPVLAICGRGNNGADALAAGRLLTDAGYQVRFLRLPGEVPEGSSLQTQLRILDAYGLPVEEYSPGCSMLNDFAPAVLIDGIFGTGLSREVTGAAADLIHEINEYREGTDRSRRPRVYAVDIPSGISAENGQVMGCAVRCDKTVTFAYYKRGHYYYPGTLYCGETIRKEIGITDRSLAARPGMFTLSADELRDMLPPRDSGGNKGTFGKVLVIAGTAGMCGAAVLCARACLRSGAGMVKVFTREENRIILQTALPEAMISTYSAGEREILREKMTDDLAWADVAVCGPGLGRDRDASFIVRALLDAAAAEETPVRGLVLDADALWLVGRHSGLSRLLQKRNPACACIMTPHPGELAALMDCTVGELDQDRSVPGRECAVLYRAVVCCKDARTAVVVPGREEVFLNVSGNSGMATAGSGDVLAGMAGAFLALGLNADKAAVAAVGLHGAAGDLCAREIGESGMIAGDIADRIPRTLQ